MPRTAVVIGRAGQLGAELSRELASRGWNVTGFNRQALNITDAAQVEQAIAAENPDLVLNAAAYNQVDVAEKEPLAAYMVNGLAVRNIALACRQADAHFVHFSTDYVFDGVTTRPYTEIDTPHPLSAYGVSKLAGEYYARAYLDRALVIRTSGVFGPAGRNTARGNFVELMLRNAANGNPIRVVEDHVASPTFAPELARLTLDLVERSVVGVVHGGGETPISWYDYAKLIFRCAGLNPEVRPTNEREYRTAARRPKYSALANTRAAASGITPVKPLEECVNLYLAARGQA